MCEILHGDTDRKFLPFLQWREIRVTVTASSRDDENLYERGKAQPATTRHDLDDLTNLDPYLR